MRVVRRILLMLCLALWLASAGRAQEQDTVARQKELPKLEIPEITIIGRKAITLPFARKGEIYDVNIYDAPPPDTSLLLDRPGAPLPVGSLPRYEQREQPWRASVLGSFGSFSTGNLHGYIDYKAQQWGISSSIGYSTTEGHTVNASGSAVRAGLAAYSLIHTDNDILRSLRGSLGLRFDHDSYGMFGVQTAHVERERDHVVLYGSLGSLRRQGTVLDVSFEADIWTVTDARAGVDSEVSVVSPKLTTSFAADIGDIRLLTGLSYSSSSLDYRTSTESPTLIDLSVAARWQLQDQLFLQLGGMYAGGSDYQGNSRTLLAPRAMVKYEIDPGRTLAVWFQPEMQLSTYDDHTQRSPYVVMEIGIRPERKPISIGGTVWYNRGILALELTGSYSESSNKEVTLADSGNIHVEYVDARQVHIQATGSVNVSERGRLNFTGVIQPAREKGGNSQLAMLPLVVVRGRGEIDFDIPLKVWSTAEYQSKRNIDRTGNTSLGDFITLGAGASSNTVPRTLLSLEVSNIFNTAYEWWNGYVAPGRRILLGANIRLQ
ncbi:MAG: TonB-dependent receptor [Ignavibacteriae bacterium]|nr:TonB-dependent receptor [Ignavibacteriota bacterium]